MCQPFSEHKVKQLSGAFRSPLAINNYWQKKAFTIIKCFDIFKYILLSFGLGLITLAYVQPLTIRQPAVNTNQ
jgi:hypothetical protein